MNQLMVLTEGWAQVSGARQLLILSGPLVSAILILLGWRFRRHMPRPVAVAGGCLGLALAVFWVSYSVAYVRYKQADNKPVRLSSEALQRLSVRSTKTNRVIPGSAFSSVVVLRRGQLLIVQVVPDSRGEKVMLSALPDPPEIWSRQSPYKAELLLDGKLLAKGRLDFALNPVDPLLPVPENTGFVCDSPDFFDVYLRLRSL